MELIAATLVFFCTRLYIYVKLGSEGSLYTDGDSIGHLNYLKSIEENKGLVVDKLQGYVLDYNDYPNGFHKIVYLLKLPLTFIEKHGGLLPILFDYIYLLLAYIMLVIFAEGNEHWVILFPFLKILISNNGRSSHFSERAFGVLCGSAYLIATLVIFQAFSYSIALLSLLVFVVFSVSSKFAWQATFFISVVLTILLVDYFFVGWFLVCAVMSFVVTKGYSLRVLKGCVRHSIFYKNYLSKKYFGLPKHYFELLKLFGKSSLKRKAVILLNNSVLRVITDNPLNAVILLLLFLGGGDNVFFMASLAAIIVALFICTEPLKFLGEPERYLEFVLVPSLIVSAQSDISDFYFALILLLTLAIFLAQFFVLMVGANKKKSAQSEHMKQVVSFIESESSAFLTIPLRLSFFLGYFNRKSKFVTYFSNIAPGELGDKYKELIPDYYPFPGRDLSHYVADYQVKFIVVDVNKLKGFESTLGFSYYDFSNFDLVFENPSYLVFCTEAL